MENSWWVLELLPDEVNQVAEEIILKDFKSGVSVRIWLLREFSAQTKVQMSPYAEVSSTDFT